MIWVAAVQTGIITGDLRVYLSFAAAMFCVGAYGVLSRRNAVGVLLSLELMANAVNVIFVAFARFSPSAAGQVFALFGIALTVAEVVVSLAIVVLLYRSRHDVLVEAAEEMHG